MQTTVRHVPSCSVGVGGGGGGGTSGGGLSETCSGVRVHHKMSRSTLVVLVHVEGLLVVYRRPVTLQHRR